MNPVAVTLGTGRLVRVLADYGQEADVWGLPDAGVPLAPGAGLADHLAEHGHTRVMPDSPRESMA